MNEDKESIEITSAESRILEAYRNLKPGETLKINVSENGVPYLAE